MQNPFMSIEYLLHTEREVFNTTMVRSGELSADLTNLISILFKLSHFLNEDTEINSDDHWFQIVAYHTYLKAPYTLYTIHELWKKGYYLESLILLRHIVEGFVILRYFNLHRDKLKNHINGKSLVRFKRMFNECAPGFYKRHYGRILSGIAHGSPISNLFRTQYSSPTEGRVILGCEYNKKHSNGVIGQTLSFAYAYLNYIDQFFPSISSKISNGILHERNTLLDVLKKKMSGERESKEQQKEWETVVLPFIEKNPL